MGDVIAMHSLDDQIHRIQSQLDEMRDELTARVRELIDQDAVDYYPLRDRLWELKGRRGDEGFGEIADAG